MSRPLVIAHRGDSSRALENSLDAFRLALTIPVDMIELDIRMSRDHRLFVMHDHRTGRTCDRDLSLEKSLAADVESIRLRNGERIPTLDDVLRLVDGRAALNLEIKSAGAAARTAAHIAAAGYRGSILISSFKEREVNDARRMLPRGAVAGIFDVFSPREVQAYHRTGSGFISLNRSTVTKDLVDSLHERLITVYVWTVDTEEEMRMLAGWGVDGIYSNRPALLRSVVDLLGEHAS